MKKLSFILLGILILGLGSDVFAYDDSLKPDEKDIRTWSQDDRIWKENSSTRLSESSRNTIQEGGCGLFTITYILYKAGELKEDENFLDVLDKINKADIWDIAAPDFHIDGTELNSIYKNIDIVEDDGISYWLYDLSDKTKEECLAILKKLYNKGYFISICFERNDFGSHYVFLDSFISNDNFTIMDSLFPVTEYKGSVYESDDAKFSYINVYKSDKVKNNEVDSLYGKPVIEKVELTPWEKKYLKYLKTGEGRSKKWLTYDDFFYHKKRK